MTQLRPNKLGTDWSTCSWNCIKKVHFTKAKLRKRCTEFIFHYRFEKTTAVTYFFHPNTVFGKTVCPIKVLTFYEIKSMSFAYFFIGILSKVRWLALKSAHKRALRLQMTQHCVKKYTASEVLLFTDLGFQYKRVKCKI